MDDTTRAQLALLAAYDAQAARLAALEKMVALAITHIDGKATKFSEREPIAVLQQLRAVLVGEQHVR